MDTSTNRENLLYYIGKERLEVLMAKLNIFPFRRLIDNCEHEVDKKLLCQSLHVSEKKGKLKLMLGNSRLPYYLHSLESCIVAIYELLNRGVNKVFLQILPPKGINDYNERIGVFAEYVEKLKSEFGSDLFLISDPQGLCMRRDLRWGIGDNENNGAIDVIKTADYYAQLVSALVYSKLDVLATLGRLNFEVEIARNVIEKKKSSMEIFSFSTNSETSIAYVHETKLQPNLGNTGQKIHVGNMREMIIRSVMDFVEGTDCVVQKPLEGLHVLSALKILLEDSNELDKYTKGINDKDLKERTGWTIESLKNAFHLRNQATLGLGVYEVSGTFLSLSHMLEKYKQEFVFRLLSENYINAIAAAGGNIRVIVSRCVSWYLDSLKLYKH